MVLLKTTFRLTEKPITNKIDLYFKNNLVYGKIKSDSEFEKDNITFTIKNNSFNISNIFAENINGQRTQELAFSFFQIKDFYRKIFNTNIYPVTTSYSIFRNNFEYKNLIKDCFYENDIEISGDDIIEEYKLQKFKKESDLYLNNENSLENVLKYINADKNVKGLIYQNEDIFKTYL